MKAKALPAWSGICQEGFVKIDPLPERLRVEARKSLAASSVASAGDMFHVPELLELSSDRSVSAAVGGLSSLRTVLHGMRDEKEPKIRLASRIGRILGTIHRDIRFSEDWAAILPAPYAEPDIVPIHGDFCLNNIQVRQDNQQIYVVDWSTPAWLGQWCTHGSSGWDVGVFLCSLFYQRPCDPLRISHLASIKQAFLRGYNEIRAFDVRTHRKQILQIARTYFLAERGVSRPYLRLPSLGRLVFVR